MDDKQLLEAIFAGICDKLGNRVELIQAMNKTLQDLEVWDEGAAQMIINRSEILAGLDFDDIVQELRSIAEKIKE